MPPEGEGVLTNVLAMSAVLALVFQATGTVAQAPGPAPERSAVIGAAKSIARNARFCTLVTLGDTGHPHARVVDPLPPDEDMTIWMATNPVTRKVEEIRKDPRVTLSWFDSSGPGYVTLLGTATMVTDPAEKAKRWKPDWKAFYKDEYRGDDYLLIRVTPRRLEVVSYADGIMNDPVTWRPVTVDFPATGRDEPRR